MHLSESPAAGGVLCCGNLVHDTIVRPVDELQWGRGTTFVDTIESRAGGNGCTTSRALALLGTRVRLLGAIGTDAQGTFILDVLQRSRVDTSQLSRVESCTAATVALVNSEGERKFFHRIGASADVFAEPLRFTPDLCEGASHYHQASFFVLPQLRKHGPRILADARAAGLSTSFDTNWDPLDLWMSSVEPCLPFIDVLFMNQDEARMMTGHSDPADSARFVLDRGADTAVVKLGSQGCVVYHGTEEILCPAFDVVAKDTTGAGDCFVAGFLAARLRGASLEQAGFFANAVAALSVQQIGGGEGILSLRETEAWMNSARLRIAARSPVKTTTPN